MISGVSLRAYRLPAHRTSAPARAIALGMGSNWSVDAGCMKMTSVEAARPSRR